MRKLFFALSALLVAAPLYAQPPVVVYDPVTHQPVPLATTTEGQHDTALGTITNVKALLDMCRARATAPSAVSADDDAVLGWCSLLGARAVFPTAYAAGGDDPCYAQATASTNAFNCKGSAGTVYEVSAVNVTATVYYLRIYDLASSPTCSSGTGLKEIVPIPASSTGAGIVRTYPVGRAHASGIGGCITGDAAGTTNAAVGVYVTFGYK